MRNIKNNMYGLMYISEYITLALMCASTLV